MSKNEKSGQASDKKRSKKSALDTSGVSLSSDPKAIDDQPEMKKKSRKKSSLDKASSSIAQLSFKDEFIVESSPHTTKEQAAQLARKLSEQSTKILQVQRKQRTSFDSTVSDNHQQEERWITTGKESGMLSGPHYANHLLIAMPMLDGSLFQRAVIWICAHSEKSGARGLMLNHEIDPSLGETFLREHFSISPTLYLKNRPVFLGGPQGPEFGYVLHTGQDKQYTSSACLQEGLYLTISKDIIAAMARNKGPEKSLFLMGSCQWEPKVLESEIAKHYWMVIPGTPDFIFSIPTEKRWRRAMELAGIDNPYQLTQCVGHG